MMMDKALIETLKQWNITYVLPLQVGDFKLSAEYRLLHEGEKDESFLLFQYCNDKNGWSVRAVFNPESEEYAVRTDIGMLEFALIEFITDQLPLFRSLVETRLARIIQEYYADRKQHFGIIVKHKGLPQAQWEDMLPPVYKHMTRLITPDEAVRIINGSYMVLAYYDRDSQSGLSVMYNLLRDDFFAERRVHNFPNLVHQFDSTSLEDLRSRLQMSLLPVLDDIAAERDRGK